MITLIIWSLCFDKPTLLVALITTINFAPICCYNFGALIALWSILFKIKESRLKRAAKFNSFIILIILVEILLIIISMSIN